jgi:hypothetical protein
VEVDVGVVGGDEGGGEVAGGTSEVAKSTER